MSRTGAGTPHGVDALPHLDVEQAALPTALLSPDGRLLQVSRSFATLLQLPFEQLAGQSAADLCSDIEDRAALLRALDSAETGQLAGEVDLRLSGGREQEQVVVMTWSLLPRGADTQPVLRSVWFPTGLSPVASEARWQSLLHNAADITWTADAEGRITSATTGVLDQLGWEFRQIDHACAIDFVHPHEQEAFRAAWERLVTRTSRQEVVECRVRRADGGWTWMRETLTDLRDDPYVRSIVGNVVDITQWHHERQARARHEAHLRARFEQSLVPQATVDVRGLVVAANDALGTLIGQPAGMVLDQPLAVLAHPLDPGLVDRAVAQLLTGERQSTQVEGTLVGAAGRPVPVLADLSAFCNEHGSPAGVAVFWHDLTRLRDAEQRQRQQEEFFLALNRRANDVAVVTDAEGTVLHVSSAVRHMLGHDVESLLGADCWELVHPDDRRSAQEAYSRVLRTSSTETIRMRARDASGGWRHMEVTASNLLDTAVGGIVSNLVDVTDRVEAERALRASEARYRAIADTGGEGIWALSPQGSTLYANARMAEILGVSQEEVYGGAAVSLVAREHLARLEQRLRDASISDTVQDEVAYQHPTGDQRVLSVAATLLQDVDGALEGYLAMVSDVTEARRTERELRHAAVHDGLTGLPNRTLLLDRLEHALERESSGTAVVFVDLDHFKLVNDSRGHGSGDELLVAVADRLRGAIRPSDTLARFGGDEFVAVCEDVDEPAAGEIAEQLLASLAEPVDIGFGPVHVSASVGVATSPGASASDLLRFADTAMYAAKAAGRGRVRHFDASLAEEAEGQYELAMDLRAAIEHNALALHYQPVIELTSGRVLGCEALARWHHPVHGVVPPARFVAVAELAGLAADLDGWVLSRALHEAAALRAGGALPAESYIAVNLSARNLNDPHLEQLVVAATESAALSPTDVVLEITEGAVMGDTQVAVALLRRLRDRGFGIAIDDFGVGYSSLAYLRELPISILKIDRSFVGHITDDRDSLAIVASIVDLARAVGVSVVAEGVETAQQAAALRRLGCAAGQGWLWTPAIAPEDVPADGRFHSGFASAEVTSPRPPRRRRPQPEVGAEHGLERLLALHAEGASLATIASALTQEGFRTPSGLRWHRTSVARVIASAAYPDTDL